MMAIADWVEIIDKHNAKYDEKGAVLELCPSEIDRLRHDLLAAREAIAAGAALIDRYEKLLERTRDMAERYKDEAEKALELARKYAALELVPEHKRPAPSDYVQMTWAYRPQDVQ